MRSLFVLLLFLILSSSCEKDLFKDYKKRIVGIWSVKEINEIGNSGTNIPFNKGTYYFESDNSFKYVSEWNEVTTGTWHIDKDWEWENAGCEGCGMGNEKTIIIDYSNGHTEEKAWFLLQEMKFTGDNKFNATYTQNHFAATYYFTNLERY